MDSDPPTILHLRARQVQKASMADLAAAWRRVERALRRRPNTGLQDDAAATVQWTGGAKVVAIHANGTELRTDMPPQLGGDGAGVTPGWLLRAGLASCAATTIAMRAAVEGIELRTLQIIASSRSDTRGLLGMTDADGKQIPAGPRDVRLQVRISAADATSPQKLRELVERSHQSSPVSCAMRDQIEVELHIVCEDT
jgi:organic hydroperoxide reductase OsmC/OhrA